MWCWTTFLDKQDRLKASERELLEYARQFKHSDEHSYNIRVFDTPIPNAKIPLRLNEKEKAELKLHGVHVTSDTPLKSTPLVFIHGYMNASCYFYRNIVGLSRHFSSIYSLDLLGWGLSSRPRFVFDRTASTTSDPKLRDIRLAEQVFVESLEAWRVQNKIDRMILAGHSLGGYLTVAYCERYPQHVERLILVSPVGVPEENKDDRARRAAELHSSWIRRVQYGVIQSLFEQERTLGNIIRLLPAAKAYAYVTNYVHHRLPSIQDPREKKAVSEYLYFNNVLPGSGEYCVAPCFNLYGFAKDPTVYRIPKLKIQHVTFLYGEQDWVDPAGALQVQRLSEQCDAAPKVTVYRVPDSGHLLLLDNWEGFNAGILVAAGMELDPDCTCVPEQIDPDETHDLPRGYDVVQAQLVEEHEERRLELEWLQVEPEPIEADVRMV